MVHVYRRLPNVTDDRGQQSDWAHWQYLRDDLAMLRGDRRGQFGRSVDVKVAGEDTWIVVSASKTKTYSWYEALEGSGDEQELGAVLFFKLNKVSGQFELHTRIEPDEAMIAEFLEEDWAYEDCDDRRRSSRRRSLQGVGPFGNYDAFCTVEIELGDSVVSLSAPPCLQSTAFSLHSGLLFSFSFLSSHTWLYTRVSPLSLSSPPPRGHLPPTLHAHFPLLCVPLNLQALAGNGYAALGTASEQGVVLFYKYNATSDAWERTQVFTREGLELGERVRFSPNGKYAVIGGDEGEGVYVLQLDAETGEYKVRGQRDDAR
jgi:hypothetical protein